MKNLIGSLLILMTLFSCSKSDTEYNPEAPILGKWKLSSPINNNPELQDVKEQFFVFDTDKIGIRGIRLNGKFGGSLASWDRNATIKHDYSLSNNNKILNINYEDGEIVDFDVLKLSKDSLIIEFKNYNIGSLHFSRSK